ncbi:hypothetical protein GPY51_20130 [Photorhabdus laumondii subsp. laumondii]|uniref:Photorhabdus luminescens subsp. laumondii TTO1 complete genome segment 11/17 n=2 Tax=Photorhabdus laumondii subsp. laumondii TaxID=141679 RepID=Q7N273_PHOLL|nr:MULTISPECIES: hypothetical protein [Photorhabdus]AWK42911.1 hypothetical protein A4R40_16075 [Photorhabdus laumondii subsp. laumondii]AXG43685.1 hypothetical protein PluDJC_16455 [Photorhabdus laumondii subsp. laumondii]AXG48230.1 hypothetical protein PluTT01m_16580 [Photorhabdus laumondii subsp. laumondii]KTL60631.1 hypothetical protein AA106_12070 [Photorhabdus laumondii subsp. laumondii]MCC8385793.1 hypothetical protein [Photorhabdus laumondii]
MPARLVNPEKVNEVFAHLNESSDNHTLYTALMNGVDITDQIKGLLLSPGYRMVRVDGRFGNRISQSHFELALVNDVSKEVAYYNRVVIQPDVVSNCRPVTQILVWRIRTPQHRAVLRDLAGKVFFDYLLEHYNVIVSDMNQTTDGIAFWQDRMYDALAYNMHVYAYDMITCELRKILTQNDVSRQESWLWGDPEHHQNRLAIISKSELPIYGV